MPSFTDGLNAEQVKAVLSNSKQILMLAGAGTGKTRTLTHRLADLNINGRVGASSIVAITFTRAAAKEMKDRLGVLIGQEEAQKLTCCTFHALAVRILQEWGHRLGLDKHFTIYSQEDRNEILSTIINTMGFKTSVNKVISATNSLMSGHQEESVWKEYEWQLRRFNAVDLDYLIPKVNQLFETHPDVAEYYRKQWRYIFVDEFQDTDKHQMAFIRHLKPDHLFCIGDWRQSIYGWRGARVRNILEFQDSYPGAEIIELNQNYRSTTRIVEAANNLISHSDIRLGEPLIASRDGFPPHIYRLINEDSEMEMLTEAIETKLSEEKFSDFAILARTNAQIEQAYRKLRAEGIPCVILSNSDDALKKPDIRTMISCLEWIFNPKDEANFKQVIRFPERMLTDIQLQMAEQIAIDESIPLWDAMIRSREDIVFQFASHLSRQAEAVRGNHFASEAFRELSREFQLKEFYEERSLHNRIEDLDRAITYILYWTERQQKAGEDYSPEAFLKWVKIRDIQEKLMDERDAVKLMTIHGSKGLEFPTVFLIGMNDGTFPSRNTKDLDEERRLAYVAVTRARDNLYISTTRTAASWGKTVDVHPSRFLSEMNEMAY